MQKGNKVVLAGIIGNTLEWYDFALYGFTALIISKLFFPSDHEFLSLMSTYGVFAAGFIMRPLGAILFGYIGDRYGRKISLSISILLMAVPTAVIGILPTYAEIGIIAPITLTVIRLLQGLSLGGEFGGCTTFLIEHSPNNKKGFIGSTTMFSNNLGMLIGNGVIILISSILPKESYEVWGWRIPFLLGILIAVVGFYIRNNLEESDDFKKSQKSGKLKDNPLKEIFQYHKKNLFIGIAINLTVMVPFYAMVFFLAPCLAKYFGFEHEQLLGIVANTVLLFFIPIGGYISDYIGFKKLMRISCIASILLSAPMFYLASTKSFALIIGSQVVLALINSFFKAPVPAVLVELFPTNIRYTALSLSYNITSALFAGTVPLICFFLTEHTGSLVYSGLYITILSMVTYVGINLYKEKRAHSFDKTDNLSNIKDHNLEMEKVS